MSLAAAVAKRLWRARENAENPEKNKNKNYFMFINKIKSFSSCPSCSSWYIEFYVKQNQIDSRLRGNDELKSLSQQH